MTVNPRNSDRKQILHQRLQNTLPGYGLEDKSVWRTKFNIMALITHKYYSTNYLDVFIIMFQLMIFHLLQAVLEYHLVHFNSPKGNQFYILWIWITKSFSHALQEKFWPDWKTDSHFKMAGGKKNQSQQLDSSQLISW